MIGVFDSGVGGYCAFREIRRLLPREDIVYLADRKNAPYGTKTKDEIITLTKADIKRLRTVGATNILIACCTASTVYDALDTEEREISLPIIRPAAEKAVMGAKKVAVIATERTVASGAFTGEISRLGNLPVGEFAAQKLVALVEGGCRDGRLTVECERELDRVAELVLGFGADTLILGCTHFSHLENELRQRCNVRTVSPAREGAIALVKRIQNFRKENGKTIYM